MKKFYFTFGHGQVNFPGYAKVEADGEYQARLVMSKLFDGRYCGCYSTLEDVHPDDRKERFSIVYIDKSDRAS